MFLVAASRAVLGIKEVWDTYWSIWPNTMPNTFSGTSSEKTEIQDFIDTTAKTMGVSKPIFLREDPEHRGWPSAHALGTNALPGKAQILLAENSPLTEDEIKFACCHEIAHIANNDWLFRLARRVSAATILFCPLVPHWAALTTSVLSRFLFVPLTKWQERRADFFGLQHCPPEIRPAALTMLDKKELFEQNCDHLPVGERAKLLISIHQHPSIAERRAMVRKFLEH